VIIYLQTKFGANRSGNCLGTRFCIYPRWRMSTHFPSVFYPFLLSTTVSSFSN